LIPLGAGVYFASLWLGGIRFGMLRRPVETS
jgi:cbb3-type cytochrome oxidase subunit 1